MPSCWQLCDALLIYVSVLLVCLQVRRAKLYYLRQRTGKNARLKELFVKKDKPAAN